MNRVFATALVVAVVGGLLVGWTISNRAPTATPPAAKSPAVATRSRPETETKAPDITAGGPAPQRTDPEQRTTFDDVHYIPPIGSRQILSLDADLRSILLGRLDRAISAKTGRAISVPMAWAYKEEDGDLTICGAYRGKEEQIVFVYNSGIRDIEPQLLLNVDEATYSSFGCGAQTGVKLVG
jgi:hypothetical protein